MIEPSFKQKQPRKTRRRCGASFPFSPFFPTTPLIFQGSSPQRNPPTNDPPNLHGSQQTVTQGWWCANHQWIPFQSPWLRATTPCAGMNVCICAICGGVVKQKKPWRGGGGLGSIWMYMYETSQRWFYSDVPVFWGSEVEVNGENLFFHGYVFRGGDSPFCFSATLSIQTSHTHTKKHNKVPSRQKTQRTIYPKNPKKIGCSSISPRKKAKKTFTSYFFPKT